MTISGQFFSLLAMIGSGIIAGALLDMIGTGIAKTGKSSVVRRQAIWLESAGWLLAGGIAFVVLFTFRYGEWRMYDPFAQAAGLLIYASFFYKPFRFVGRLIILLFIRPILAVIRLLAWCVRTVFRAILTVILIFLRPVRYVYRRFFKFFFENKRK